MEESLAREFAAALMDPAQPLPPGLRTWSGCDPTRRLDVHRNNVVVSLVDALAISFPVTQALVGVDFFRAMARVYVGASPPVSRIMAEYGNTFADFIAHFPPAAGLPYLSDVARLEYLRVVAYHAADATPLAADAFHRLLDDPGQLLGLQFELHPAARWLRSAQAVFSLWAAHQDGADLHGIDISVGEAALVVRPADEVQVLWLPPGGVELLDALSTGASLTEAIGWITATGVEFDLPRLLAGLIENGLVVRLVQPSGDNA